MPQRLTWDPFPLHPYNRPLIPQNHSTVGANSAVGDHRCGSHWRHHLHRVCFHRHPQPRLLQQVLFRRLLVGPISKDKSLLSKPSSASFLLVSSPFLTSLRKREKIMKSHEEKKKCIFRINVHVHVYSVSWKVGDNCWHVVADNQFITGRLMMIINLWVASWWC